MSVLAEASRQDATTTAAGPTTRSVFRTSRGPVLVAGGVALVALLLGLVAASGKAGELDPRAYDPSGAHALAALLQQRGTQVSVIGTVDDAERRADDRSTVLVPFPERLTPEELSRLTDIKGELLLVGAGGQDLTSLRLPVAAGGEGLTDEVREPACDLPAATRAGTALVGGPGYELSDARDVQATGCYATGGRASLLVLPALHRTLLGSGAALSNAHLGQDGNASLALGLLTRSSQVLWLLPEAGRSAAAQDHRTLRDLLPSGLNYALLELAVAAVVLALWRARRLGRVVVEPLPVVVRAAETVEGRSRLYRASGARDRAADVLRDAARDSATRWLRLGSSPDPAALVSAAAQRTGRPAGELELLLYGPAPGDDRALVRLASALRTFTHDLEESGS
jgi:hypothetical protein